jgi:hypothetical protein
MQQVRFLKLTTNDPTGVLEPQVSFSNTPQQDMFLSYRILLLLFTKFHVEYPGGVTFLDATGPVTNHTPATFGFICTSAVFLSRLPLSHFAMFIARSCFSRFGSSPKLVAFLKRLNFIMHTLGHTGTRQQVKPSLDIHACGTEAKNRLDRGLGLDPVLCHFAPVLSLPPSSLFLPSL